MKLTILEKAELLISDAKKIGLWTEEEATNFIRKIEEGKIGEDMYNIMEKDIISIINILDNHEEGEKELNEKPKLHSSYYGHVYGTC